MKKIERLEVRFHDKPVGTLSFGTENRLCAFEYDRGWLAEGFSISPIELPLKGETFLAKPVPFGGSFGIFEDSLPDGYGRYLLHKALMRDGIDDSTLTALDRLSIVGSHGMGALTYRPVSEIVTGHEVDDFDALQRMALEVLRERQDTDAELLLFNSANSGGARPKAVFEDADGHWLVKFRHTYDPKDIGRQEYEYNEAARRSCLDVPDFRLVNGKYFASRRFDMDERGERRHVATAGALLGLSLSMPYLDYRNLLSLTGWLTQEPADVEEMFRRAVFNYMTDNKDDHCKNFSFMVVPDEERRWRWRLAPAYDLTYSTDGYNGQHATSVNGTGTPTAADFLAIGEEIRIARHRCLDIIDQVRDAVGPLVRRRL